jgi:hypothetical protein
VISTKFSAAPDETKLAAACDAVKKVVNGAGKCKARLIITKELGSLGFTKRLTQAEFDNILKSDIVYSGSLLNSILRVPKVNFVWSTKSLQKAPQGDICLANCSRFTGRCREGALFKF